MIKKNDLFDYGYYIYQNSDYFKFSLDSILLAEFVQAKPKYKILDMCTGNAPIPMILTSKYNNIEIDAVEIQKEIYNMAKSSIDCNRLDNINLYNEDIKQFDNNKKYDIITCNPPYFKVDKDSQTNVNDIKRIARHEIKLKLDDVIAIAYNKLKDNGEFYMVHRSDRFLDVISSLEKNKLGIRKICFVYTKEKANAEFFLIKACKSKKSDPKIQYLCTESLKTYKGIFKEA